MGFGKKLAKLNYVRVRRVCKVTY